MRRRNRITLARPFMLTPEQVSTAKPSQLFAVAPQMNTFESAMASNVYPLIYNGVFTIKLSIKNSLSSCKAEFPKMLAGMRVNSSRPCQLTSSKVREKTQQL